jgi:hypothetical protein
MNARAFPFILPVASVALVLLGACRRDHTEVDRSEPARTNTTGTVTTETPGTNQDTQVRPFGATMGSAGVPEEVADRIASERCARESKCNNVGAGKRYADEGACMSDLKRKNRDELNSYDCKGGVDSKELNECLAEIRNEGCNNPLDTLGRLAACRSSDLCLSTR